jgi:BirA family biotin operon repressor/biotin-[acetyl-CoA-carboxylase] ligase
LLWSLKRYDNVDSTQQIARDLVDYGEHFRTVVIANSQGKGEGRRRRKWYSPIGGLYATAVLKPRTNVGLIPLLGGLTIVEATISLTRLTPILKWPNDVLINNHKVAGVLTEVKWKGNESKFVLLGIGVNINNQIPCWLQNATSLSLEYGRQLHIEEFLQELLKSLEKHLKILDSVPSIIIKKWKETSNTLGREVEVTQDNGCLIKGLAVDLDTDGALLVDSGDKIQRVVSGIISIR